jgi:putative redox protein
MEFSMPAPASRTTASVVTLESTHGYQHLIRSGTHTLVVDEPAARGGQDAGPNPTAMVLAGLAGCTAITLQMYAARKGWKLGNVHVRVEADGDGDNLRVDRRVVLEAPLEPDQLSRLAEIAERTPVTRLLKNGVPIATRIEGTGTPAEP